jgi:quinoprotein glucose dehydrogenase
MLSIRALGTTLISLAVLTGGRLLAQRAAASPLLDSTGWPAYGRNAEATRFSPLAQINRGNVARLVRAWSYRTGELGQGARDAADLTFEATPILFEGALYLATAFGKVIAVDPGTGQERWTWDAAVPRQRSFSELASRGVAAWRDQDAPADGPCAARIFVATIDARLIALDAGIGRPCVGFGDSGTVHLAREVGMERNGDYQVTSAPTVVNGLVVVGSSIGDNWSVETADGVVRGYDARTGLLRWKWQPIPRDSAGFRAGAANAWGPMAADPARDLVFVVTGSPSPDFFGGLRPGDNRWANSVVALRGTTGELVWGFQTVHHDLWDRDPAAGPMLVELRRDGRMVPAVVQATKMGFVFVLTRETGKPLFPVEERPVATEGAPGEGVAPTQPFPVQPRPLVRTEPLTPADAWGPTDEDRAACRAVLERVRTQGIYTPPSEQGTLIFPGNIGGVNWGGAAYHPDRGLAVVQVHHWGTLVELIAAAAFDSVRRSGGPFEYARQRGAPFGMRRRSFRGPSGLPCTPPPWTTLTAVNLADGKVAWEVPFGTPPHPTAVGKGGLGAVGGPIVTAGGLVFIGAARDGRFRAYDVETGRELWSVELPHAGVATPMTYQHQGRQYVVIAAGGHGKQRLAPGDFLIAFALPGPGATGPTAVDLAGRWDGEFNIESIVVPGVLDLTRKPGDVTARLELQGLEVTGPVNLTVKGDSLRVVVRFTLRERNCSGTLEAWGRPWDAAMLVGQLLVDGGCSDGSPELGSFTLRRR